MRQNLFYDEPVAVPDHHMAGIAQLGSFANSVSRTVREARVAILPRVLHFGGMQIMLMRRSSVIN